MKIAVLISLALAMIALTFGPPIICYLTEPRPTIWKVYTVQLGDTTDCYETSNPDSLIQSEMSKWSKEKQKETEWVRVIKEHGR